MVQQNVVIWFCTLGQEDHNLGFMKDRREFLAFGLAGLAAVATRGSETAAGFGIRTISTYDLPPVSLKGWQATIRELTFPPSLTSPKHTHPGFVLGYVLAGKLRFHLEGEPERLLSARETFYEGPGAIHLLSGSASATKPAAVLVVQFAEKGKKLIELL